MKTALGFLLFGVAACRPSEKADMTLCASLAEIESPKKNPVTSVDLMDQAERCVHRMAYRLSVSPGSNTEIAKAAVKSCEGWIGQVAASNHSGTGLPSAAELEQQIEMTKADEDDYREKASMWVIQARAGHCAMVLEAKK